MTDASRGHDMNDKNLVGRATRSSIWVVGARLLVRVSDLLLLMVLTRILLPEDFGLVAIATSVVAILDVVTDLPLATPLVRLDAPTELHLHTAFTLGTLRGLVIFGVMLAAAAPAAAFYGDPRLLPLLLVLAAASALYNLRSPKMALLFKQLEFRQSFLVEVGGKLLGIFAALLGAILLGNYWVLAISPVVSRIASVVLSYLYAPYRPGLSMKEWRYFWEFLGWMMPSQLIVAVAWQFDRLFLGRVVPTAALGYYGLASNVTSILEQTVRRAVTAPLISGFVLASKELERVRRGYTMADTAIFTFGIPVYLLTFFLADPLLRLAFGEKWIAAVPLLAGLSLAMLPALVRIPFRPLAMALGRTDYVFNVALLSLAFRVPAVWGGFVLGGMQGVAFGIGLANIGNAVVSMIFIRKLISVSIREQMLSNWRPVLAALPLAALAWPAGTMMAQMPIGLELGLAFVLSSALAVAVYFGAIFILWLVIGRPDGIEARIARKICSRFGS
ncbi:oligosaccharide flippase family protein [Alloyangia pacifica]|uniref:oligosaccharide flippase family protein n=1 Tax=Alloyangia pacifica TaxID=311180 RepID=UPI001CD295ED|nr:oligosaccharide flippase family protein [Alloyangia pacifica]MCA0995109.1 oligosaccharide flippase family protein [Alloyangia pacifica]